MKLMQKTKTFLADFIREDEGAQVVEYALIIALVSIALAAALGTAFSAAGGPFSQLITRVGNCLTGPTCT